MSAHLTDEQLTAQLSGTAQAGTQEHLALCPECRREEQAIRNGLAEFREVLHREAERPEIFWERHARVISARLARSERALQWNWAAAVAAIVLFAVALSWTPAKAPQPAAQSDPDHDLLVEIERSLNRQVPRALEPASLLAQEVSRAAQTKSNP
jgi:predicted anti-sigma-YlaC factor YlaD